MKIKNLSILIAVLLVAVIFSSESIYADNSNNSDFETTTPFAAGNGTSDDPFQISTIEELDALREYSDKNFTLMNDLDFKYDASYAYYGNKGDYIIGNGWNPLCDFFNPFKGTFDGQNYTISNLFINNIDFGYIGLFGRVSSGAKITNLGLIDVNLTGSNSVGSLAGSNLGSISYSYATGNVNCSESMAGGFVGFNGGNISNSYASVIVHGNMFVGGFAGQNYGSISNCYSKENVAGKQDVGGLVGLNGKTLEHLPEKYEGSISGSYAKGAVTGEYDVGGLVGSNEGDISNCYATGSVTGNSSVDGLVGSNSGTISDSYATGNVNSPYHSQMLMVLIINISIILILVSVFLFWKKRRKNN